MGVTACIALMNSVYRADEPTLPTGGNMAQTDKKFKTQRSVVWEHDGHRLNLYINAYLNVPVRTDKFMDYIAAGLESVAAELRDQAATARGVYLQKQAQTEEIPETLRLTEEKEVQREVKQDEKTNA